MRYVNLSLLKERFEALPDEEREALRPKYEAAMREIGRGLEGSSE